MKIPNNWFFKEIYSLTTLLSNRRYDGIGLLHIYNSMHIYNILYIEREREREGDR